MPAESVLPSDSISQAPRSRRHRRERSSGYLRNATSRPGSGQPMLTEANLHALNSDPVALSKRSSRTQEVRDREVVVSEEERDEIETLKQSSRSRPSVAARSAVLSKVSSSHRSAAKSTRDVDRTSPSQTSSGDKSPKKWVIVEVNEYDDRVVEKEYTIERVRRYRYD